MFNVSTDYLINDNVNNDMDIPAVKVNTDTLNMKYRIKTLSVVSTGIILIGLIVSIIAVFIWQLWIGVGIGFIIQIIGILVFEALYFRYAKSQIRRHFYALNTWFLLPFPAYIISKTVLGLYGGELSLSLVAVVYFSISVVLTFALLNKPKNR